MLFPVPVATSLFYCRYCIRPIVSPPKIRSLVVTSLRPSASDILIHGPRLATPSLQHIAQSIILATSTSEPLLLLPSHRARGRIVTALSYVLCAANLRRTQLTWSVDSSCSLCYCSAAAFPTTTLGPSIVAAKSVPKVGKPQIQHRYVRQYPTSTSQQTSVAPHSLTIAAQSHFAGGDD